MGVKLVKTLFLLLFAIPFGGVGVFAGWVITGMVRESQAAQDWVVVAAKVEEARLESRRGSKGGITYTAIGSYRYEYGGKTYAGTQLGLDRHGFAEQDGDWQHEMVDYLTDAKDKGKTISVYVDPGNPGHALVDREMRWGSVVVLIVFGGLFGAIGFGLLIPIVATWFEPDPARAQQRNPASRAKGVPGGAIESDGTSSAVLSWVIAFFWNLIAFPAAFVAVPAILESGDYWALFVLIFPFVGLLFLWSAISATWGALRRGRVTLTLEPEFPQGGASFRGAVRFGRGVAEGTNFTVRLQRTKNTETVSKNRAVVTEWWKDVAASARRDAQGARVDFRFELPIEEVPADGTGEAGARIWYEWRIAFNPSQRSGGALFGFPVPIRPAPAGARSAHTAKAAKAVDRSLEAVFGSGAASTLSAEAKEAYASLSPGHREIMARAGDGGPLLRKVAVGVAILVAIWIAYDSYTLFAASP